MSADEPLFTPGDPDALTVEEDAWHRNHCGDFYCPCRDEDDDDYPE